MAGKSSHTMTSKTPLVSNLDTLPATVPASTKASIQESLATLRTSFRQGKLRSLEARKCVLRQIHTLLTEGTPLLEAAVKRDLHKHPTELHVMELAGVYHEIQEFLDYLDEWAAPEKVGTNLINLPGSSSIISDPLGVCCILGTWNYPVSLLLVPLVGCIGAGNTALLRLPTDGTADHTSAALAHLLDKYVDQTVVRYVAGGIDANIAMLAEKYDLIFCTGGTTIGTIVARAAAETLTPIVLELGGKSPCIVDSKVDLNVAASRIVWGAFANCGQTCVRPDYLFVHASVADTFVALVLEKIKTFYGAQPETSDSYGRLVNAAQFNRLSSIVDADRAFIACGGQRDAADRYLAPTVLDFGSDVAAFQASAAMSRGELFGPVLPIVSYTDLDAVIDFINARPKPLSLYVFSDNKQGVVDPVLAQTSSGSACVNDALVQITNGNLPFGGVGTSGMGAYHGKHSFRAFSHQKAVVRKTTKFDMPQRYMPYTAASSRIIKAAASPITRTQTRLFVAAAAGAVVAIVAALVWAVVPK
ncbi:hypothetical protein H310_10077 [Aphanomyces invadans]|uniref:Aldehyde dehydrogenase n=1 Tax=Aphanomyces invadans TaxID=157072 RepID=A0A024TRY0_9STRA|nr:hypothetical protein H310_10077 [Aphanomyces invadans]ETV96769.1 hypothetical protein H310_10077 [Aphanomyces invadans]|eukprot:XP_008874546.1 hypothetical protein H310_10077 [Aphanomyces invadans]